jgi:hypothetical protein
MKKYEIFLETVRDKNIDDFDEIQAIVSRYQVLEGNNKNLHNDQENLTRELDLKTRDLQEYIKEMDTEQITINNKCTMQNQ